MHRTYKVQTLILNFLVVTFLNKGKVENNLRNILNTVYLKKKKKWIVST